MPETRRDETRVSRNGTESRRRQRQRQEKNRAETEKEEEEEKAKRAHKRNEIHVGGGKLRDKGEAGRERGALLAARLAEPRPEISKRTKLNWTFIKRFLLMPQVPHRTNTHTHRDTYICATGRRIRRETKSSGSANDADDDDDDKCGQLSF